MKLLVIGTDADAFSGGSETERRVESYSRLFQELHIIVYTPRGFKEKILDSGTRLYSTNSRFMLLRPFHAFIIGRKIIAARGINLISVQDPCESGLAGLWLKWASGVPLHVQIHADIFSPFFRKNSWKELLRYWLARFIIPRGDAFRVVSQRIKDSLNSKFKIQNSKLTLLPIFVDRVKIAEAKPSFGLHQKYPQFDFIILMVARLVREKNIRLALEVFSEVLRSFPKTGLVIVGAGPERQNLELRIKNLGLTENVILEGWGNDAASYYKTADLYLLTSNFEGYSRTVVEAAAAGLPVVMTDVGVAGEIVRDGETGRVVPVGDKSALVRVLLDMRQNTAKSKEMAEKAQKLVSNLPPRTWEEYLKKYREAFHLSISEQNLP